MSLDNCKYVIEVAVGMNFSIMGITGSDISILIYLMLRSFLGSMINSPKDTKTHLSLASRSLHVVGFSVVLKF